MTAPPSRRPPAEAHGPALLLAAPVEPAHGPGAAAATPSCGDRTSDDERAALLAELHAARAAAEASARWARFLAGATESLAAAAGTRDVLDAVGGLIVPAMADFCQVFVLDATAGGACDDASTHAHTNGHAHAHTNGHATLRRAALRAVEPAVAGALHALERRGAVRADGRTLQARVARLGEPVLVREVTDALLHEIAEDDEHLALMRAVGYRSLLVVPLGAAGATLGVLVLGLTGREQRFSDADRDVAMDFARRAALAYDRARHYDRAREAREHAEAANRAKSDFLATMSHELRTPLSAVIGYAELLADGVFGPPGEAQLAPLRRITAGARHLLALIEDILGFAKLDAASAQLPAVATTDVAALAREVAAMLEPSVLQQALAFEVGIADGALPLATDARMLRQILLNLLGNAVRYTEHGTITFTVSRAADDAVAFAVADTGIGIAPEHLDRIFEPFWQVDQSHARRRGGTGLGLAVSRRLALLLGGDIVVTSVPDVGSTFTLVLPATGAAASA